jgi:hypothetical protein
MNVFSAEALVHQNEKRSKLRQPPPWRHWQPTRKACFCHPPSSTDLAVEAGSG